MLDIANLRSHPVPGLSMEISTLAEHCMPFFLRTNTLLALTFLMASCGGGGGDGAPTPSSSAVCDSGTLWAAYPATSGSAIPDNNSTGLSVNWDNQNCALQTVSSATLEICLDHPRPADLTWTITPPASSIALALTPPANWNSTSSSCDSGRGKFQPIDLLSTVSSTVSTQGNWTLRVKDQALGDSGTLIQWRVVIRGNT